MTCVLDSITILVVAMVVGLAGLMIYSRVSRRYWWSLEPRTNAVLFAASLLFVDVLGSVLAITFLSDTILFGGSF